MSFPKIAFQKDIYQFSKEKICTKDIFNNFQMFQKGIFFSDFSQCLFKKYGQNGFLCLFFFCESKFFSFYPTGFQCEIRCFL